MKREPSNFDHLQHVPKRDLLWDDLVFCKDSAGRQMFYSLPPPVGWRPIPDRQGCYIRLWRGDAAAVRREDGRASWWREKMDQARGRALAAAWQVGEPHWEKVEQATRWLQELRGR